MKRISEERVWFGNCWVSVVLFEEDMALLVPSDQDLISDTLLLRLVVLNSASGSKEFKDGPKDWEFVCSNEGIALVWFPGSFWLQLNLESFMVTNQTILSLEDDWFIWSCSCCKTNQKNKAVCEEVGLIKTNNVQEWNACI